MMHLQLHSSRVIKERSKFEWGNDDSQKKIHKSHVTNLANILYYLKLKKPLSHLIPVRHQFFAALYIDSDR